MQNKYTGLTGVDFQAELQVVFLGNIRTCIKAQTEDQEGPMVFRVIRRMVEAGKTDDAEFDMTKWFPDVSESMLNHLMRRLRSQGIVDENEGIYRLSDRFRACVSLIQSENAGVNEQNNAPLFETSFMLKGKAIAIYALREYVKTPRLFKKKDGFVIDGVKLTDDEAFQLLLTVGDLCLFS